MSNPSGNSSTSSPVKSSLYSGFEATQTQAVDFRLKLADAMTGFFVGPMPVSDFLNDFLPARDNLAAPPRLGANFFDKMGRFRLESDMAESFESYVPKELIPGFKIVNTSNHEDHNSTKKIKPDPTLYREDLVTDDKKTTQFNEIELNFELKVDDSKDPFDERPNHPFEATAKERRRCRGQLVSYATEWCTRQHRRFAFSVYMGDPFVRFIRWDRAGAVVSAKFNYREDSTPLIEFLWRFVRLERAARGWDTTVRLARPEEVNLAKQKLSQWKNQLHRDVVVFTVPDGGVEREFIAWGSMAYPESLTGRCTRAYPVYEVATGFLGFLKDSWAAEGLEKESAILRALQKKNVQHIPGFICGDDLLGDTTVTDLYVPVQANVTASPPNSPTSKAISQDRDGGFNNAIVLGVENEAIAGASGTDTLTVPHQKKAAPWRRGDNWKRITRRYHHRMVTDVIGHHLRTFLSSKVMMQAISDAFTAHQQAYESCTIIHRDISAHNILITDAGRGILNDWDLARYEKDIIDNGPRRHERTGTWQFMSCHLLRQRDKLHTIQDDMESFVYIVLYHCLRYLKHNRFSVLRLILQMIFDYEVCLEDGTRLGGDLKRSLFRGDISIFEGFQLMNHSPLSDWLDLTFEIVDEWLSKVYPSKRSPPVKPDQLVGLRLHNHQYMVDLFAHCLVQSGWPLNDKAVDALPMLPSGTTVSRLGSTFGSGTGSRGSSSSRKRLRSASEDIEEGSSGSGPTKKDRKRESGTAGSSRSFHSGMTPESGGI